ncbi:hypothetical protein DA70_09540 [Pandoraea pnomenusa]|uniref:hypothetical protein n=1 Tax=Pandoraea pnomenusa TaxID=93220 RepID=UPI0004375441|nr:hypothetical protein [Pandoraea pnomenusa]AHN77410.1 hypothetical protein DA70_09540 [Pandoraea pnomenusa]
MRYKFFVAVLSVSVLGACTSVQDVKQRTPDFTSASTKKPANVGGCVAQRWRAIDLDFKYTPIGDGVEIAVGDPGYYFAVFEAVPGEQGSNVAFYSRSWFGNEKMLSGVKACV